MIMIDVRRRIASDSCATELHVFAGKMGLDKQKDFFNGTWVKGKPLYRLPERYRLRKAIQAGATPVAATELEKRAAE